MRTLSAAIIAIVVLLTLTRVSSHEVKTLTYNFIQARNTATIAAYVMLYASCDDVDEIMRSVNATAPLPDYPVGNIIVWCGEEPRVISFSWKR
ncbi:MAG: hypothetical protein ACP5II_07685 [Infirmifilum sp.]|uniref:Uncharacterized protein n=1 Tax=Infirmifilum uzonense TaxID=1550241 RepID=A0A0F7FI05_9CREN|nr:hypothetical protein [Infirmifilum uzonense]AKG38943.1 hypothetical protein MA03_06340 [Infirmifilum uzonense]